MCGGGGAGSPEHLRPMNDRKVCLCMRASACMHVYICACVYTCMCMHARTRVCVCVVRREHLERRVGFGERGKGLPGEWKSLNKSLSWE